jgi:hypothetical protein
MPQPTAGITADASLAQAKKSAPYFKKLLTGMHTHMHMGSGMDSVREAEHRGHQIRVETTYKITIDGKPFDAALGVTNGGSVHYHGMPNVGFASALDLVKAVIDAFPDEFAKGAAHTDHGDQSHDPHHGDGGDADHDQHHHDEHHHGMTMPMGGVKPKARKRPALKRRRR